MQIISWIYSYILVKVESSKKFYLNDNQTINADIENRGLILSNNYPVWEINQNVIKTIYTTSTTSAFKIYITDISMEEPSILNGGYNNKMKLLN